MSFIGAGTCVIDANQAGNATYAAAPQVQQSFAVSAASQTISFTSAAPVGAMVGGTYTPVATATSTLPVALTIDASASAVCTITGGVVSLTGAGTCVIDANQAGNATYTPASQVQQSFAVTAGTTSARHDPAPRCRRVGDLPLGLRHELETDGAGRDPGRGCAGRIAGYRQDRCLGRADPDGARRLEPRLAHQPRDLGLDCGLHAHLRDR